MRLTPLITSCLVWTCVLPFGAHAQSISNFLEHPVPMASEQLNTDATKQLSLPDAQKFLKSTESGAWRVYGVQGPLCEDQARKKPKNISAKEWSAKRKECTQLNTECRKAQNFAKKYSVQSICSNVYYSVDILLTTAASSQ